ncbi:MAG: hypothetical protein JXM71_00665 [Spirochaetales bacterium]|nr:hypothetical protein [Spirochaetales bacterium]
MARAIDSAGNVSFATPFNLVVDPASDLPVAGIVNPLPQTRVGADLNVVGTCVDDDAVSYVELSIDDGPWAKAEGTDYWSHYLSTAAMADGEHAIHIRGVDVNGLTGEAVSTIFHLDRTKPLHTVAAPGFGAITSGRVAVSGTVFDANGLIELSYSTDAGVTWLPLKHKKDKNATDASFTLGVDTNKMPDGPAVLWLRGVDRVGSTGIAVFMYFIDNTKPELTVLSPAEDELVNGAYSIVGKASDAVGVASISWLRDKESGQVELLPGNPFFSIPFVAPAKRGVATVRIAVTDLAGNVTATTVSRRVEPDTDLPVVRLSAPLADSRADDSLLVAGGAVDDDGIASVTWRVDDGAETTVTTTGAFAFTVDGLPSGKRTLSIRATDINGLDGPILAVPFVFAGAAPVVSLSTIKDEAGERNFTPGVAVSTIEGAAAVMGSIEAASPLARLWYSVNEGVPIELSPPKGAGVAGFAVPLPPSLPYGVLKLVVGVEDSYGKIGTLRAPVLVTDYTRPRAGPWLDFGVAAPIERPSIPAGSPVSAGSEAPVPVIVRAEKPFTGRFVTPFAGENIRTVRLEPASSVVEASFSGSTVRVSATAEGSTEPTMVVVETERGHSFSSGPWLFVTDTRPPDVSIVEPAFGAWNTGVVALVVDATDGDSVATVRCTVNNGTPVPLEFADGAYRGTITVPDSGGTGAPALLAVSATDASGNERMVRSAFMVDATPPKPSRILPVDGDEISGPTLFVIQPGESLESIQSIELGRAGAYEKINPNASVSLVADPAQAPLTLRVTDKAGSTTELDVLAGLSVATTPRVALPPVELVKSNDSARPASLDGPMAVCTGTDQVGALSFTSPLIALPSGPSADAPAFPAWTREPIRVTGTASLSITMTGVSPDPKKPVAAWGLSPDAIDQSLALKPDKTGGWIAALKAPAQPDGPASIWVLVEEPARGRLFTRIPLEYDSTPPVISILAPDTQAEKAASGGPCTLVLRAKDTHGISSITYKAGADEGRFELQPGSGDAAKTFTFPPKASSLGITLRATDGSGNTSTSTLVVSYDAVADSPILSFLWPVEGATVETSPNSAPNGDETAFIVYSSDDDGEAVPSGTIADASFAANGSGPLYEIRTATPAPGTRVITASAADSGGAKSGAIRVSYTQAGAAPLVLVHQLANSADATPTSFEAGSPAVLDGKTALLATVVAPAGLAALEYSLDGAPWAGLAIPKPDADGAYIARVALPSSLSYQRHELAIRATDTAGASGEGRTAFYRVAPARADGSIPAEGVYLYDARATESDSLKLAPGETIDALWVGRPIRGMRLEPDSPYLRASFSGATISLEAVAEGGVGAEATTVVVETVDGQEFRARPLSIIVDAAAPSLTLVEPAPGAPAASSVPLVVTAADSNGLSAVEWSADGGGSWTAFEPGDDPASFAATVALASDDGPVTLMVRATDKAGVASVVLSSVWKDVTAPTITLLTPRGVDTVNGTVLLSGYATDASPLASVEFSYDGQTWEAVDASPRGLTTPPAGGDASASRAVAFSRFVDLGLLMTLEPRTEEAATTEDVSLPEAPPPSKSVMGTELSFRIVDASGNQSVLRPLNPEQPSFIVDSAADKPTTTIQIPADAEVVRSNFVVSGMAFDDDGIAELFWRLDGSAWSRLDGSNGFAVPFRLLELSDNEHLFEAYAVDLNGVEGERVSRSFRVSREEPVGTLEAPSLEITNRGIIELRGIASDANGIASVQVSFDNGATYNAAVGTESWSYILDTRLLPDGVHSVYVRLADGYDTAGFAAGLIAVDNTPPLIEMDTPLDGDEVLGSITVGGRCSDSLAVQSLTLGISKLGSDDPEMSLALPGGGVFSQAVDIQSLAPGWYNVKATATDEAGNRAYDSRNILVLAAAKADYVELLYPNHGESLSGRFSIDGRLVSSETIRTVAIKLNGQPFAVADSKKDGWFSYQVEPDALVDGDLVFTAEATNAAGETMVSEPRTLSYTKDGPWLEIDAVTTGDFIIGRPYLTGKAGWSVPEPAGSDKESRAAHAALQKARSVVRVELSRDNGRTWDKASGTDEFKYRLETQEYPNGTLRLMLKATFANGATAVRKRLVVLDTKVPTVTILTPSENGRYNGIVTMEGTANDENGIVEVAVLLRSGDKASYEVPGFIQGSYIDAHLLGATRTELGVGLTFFDDNVKLQVELGRGFDAQPTWDNILGLKTDSTAAGDLSRFGGYVLGARLLANLAYLPFSYFLGPDWDFFSMSFTLGASFTYFSQQETLGLLFSPPNGQFMVLSGVVGQWEFAKFEFDLGILQSIGAYLEGGLIFIPSEASTRLEEFIRPNVAVGLRFGLF